MHFLFLVCSDASREEASSLNGTWAHVLTGIYHVLCRAPMHPMHPNLIKYSVCLSFFFLSIAQIRISQAFILHIFCCESTNVQDELPSGYLIR